MQWQKDLPQRWGERLNEYLIEQGTGRHHLSVSDFGSNVKLVLGDSSFAYFRYAFYLLDEELDEVAVFTEHCGYHVFPLTGTRLELLDSKWTDVGTG
jgi:hypothetical protein